MMAVLVLQFSLVFAGIAAGTAVPSLDPSAYNPADVLHRDFAIVGGGSSGIYSAIRLQDYNYTVAVVEQNDYLGGHAQTYTDPLNGFTIDYGVIVFANTSVVRDYFARFDVPLGSLVVGDSPSDYVDFKTGKLDANFSTPSDDAVAAGLEAYAAQLAKYPGIDVGFNLTYPVPADLLLPFGEFITKYQLESISYLTWIVHQGYTPILKLPTLYVMKNFNSFDLDGLINGDLTTVDHNIGELYEKAGKKLGSDVLLRSNVVAMDRSSEPIKVLVQTPSGRKLIVAKKLISAIPPLLDNLHGYDLSSSEKSLFGQFFSNAYYSGVLNNTGITGTLLIKGVDEHQPQGVSPTGPYEFSNNPGANLTQVYYGIARAKPAEEVKAAINRDLQLAQKLVGLPVTEPEWLAFGDHAPFNLMVSNEAIQDRFYEKLFALQGQRNTFYTGAAWCTQSSTVIWTFSEEYLLPKILASF